MAGKSKVTENPVSRQFRTVAGLPERESDAPITNNDAPSEARLRTEPEGGYGGREGYNTAAISASEKTGAENAQRQSEAAEEKSYGEGLSGGETATEVARVTGEDVVDVKPGGTVEDPEDEDEGEQ